jgi:hypothetical protein
MPPPDVLNDPDLLVPDQRRDDRDRADELPIVSKQLSESLMIHEFPLQLAKKG